MPLYSKVLPHIEEIVLEIISITRGNIKYMLCLHIAKCTRKCLINLIRIYKSIMLSPQSNFCNLFDHVNSIFSVCLFFTIFLICLFKFSLCPFYVENDHPNPRGAQEAWEVSGRYLPWYFTKFLWHWERSKASGEKSVPLGLNRWSLIGPAFSFILWLFQLERKKEEENANLQHSRCSDILPSSQRWSSTDGWHFHLSVVTWEKWTKLTAGYFQYGKHF